MSGPFPFARDRRWDLRSKMKGSRVENSSKKVWEPKRIFGYPSLVHAGERCENANVNADLSFRF